MPKILKDFKAKKRPPRPRKARGLFKLLFGAVFLLALAISLGWLLFFAPYLKIKSIKIENNTAAPTASIQEIVQASLNQKTWFFLANDSYLLAQRSQISQNILQAFPSLKSAACRVTIPQLELKIKVEERKPFALWCFSKEQGCWLADQEGIAFATTSREKYLDELPLIISKSQKEIMLGQTIYSSRNLGLLNKVFQTITNDLKVPLERLTTDETQFLVVGTKEGWEVYINLENDMDFTLAKLKAILEQELTSQKRKGLQYIDLRFTKVYYK
jgi:cell division septal protein FtsQ